jgi:hypothetical protein
VVPTTRIGAAPPPSISGAGSDRSTGRAEQLVSDQAKIRPKVGEASSKAGNSRSTSSKPTADGSSRQLIT